MFTGEEVPVYHSHCKKFLSYTMMKLLWVQLMPVVLSMWLLVKKSYKEIKSDLHIYIQTQRRRQLLISSSSVIAGHCAGT